MWGSFKIQRLFFVLRWPLYGYGVFVALLIAIHLSSPDPHVVSFPASCPAGSKLGCSRVAETAPHTNRGLVPFILDGTSRETAQTMVVTWIMDSGAAVLLNSPGFVHARFVSWLWGFADDFFLSVRCNEQGNAVIEVQGQLRIGKSDLGVNLRRNKRLWEYLTEQQVNESMVLGEATQTCNQTFGQQRTLDRA